MQYQSPDDDFDEVEPTDNGEIMRFGCAILAAVFFFAMVRALSRILAQAFPGDVVGRDKYGVAFVAAFGLAIVAAIIVFAAKWSDSD